MTENKLSFLSNAFSDYTVEYADSFTHAVISNPLHSDNITVHYYEDDEYTPYCVCFSYQHCHLCDEEDLIDWINEIIQGERFAIEFFKGEARHFGGDIDRDTLQNISYTALEQYSGYYGSSKLMELVDSFKVRGWNGSENFDAVFVYEENGGVEIKRTYLR